MGPPSQMRWMTRGISTNRQRRTCAGPTALASRAVEPVLSPPAVEAPEVLNLRADPPPRSGGPLALLRFMRRNGMLNTKYARLLVRLAAA